ncbi:MAG: tetratricopeptide repeat protein, partial [Armatimonadota bacterium]
WNERIAADPSDIGAYLSLAAVEEKEGFHLSARRLLRAARALGAPDSATCGPLGRVLSHLAREDEARVELEKARSLAPDALEPTLNLAGFHVDARRPREAVTVLRTWIEAHPSHNAPEELQRLVLALLSCGETAGADRMAANLIAAAPNDPAALSLAARCAMDAGDAKRALSHVEKMLPSAPDPAGAQFLRGLILQRLGRHDDALAAWQEANRLNPTAPDVYERIGCEYARRGDWKKAAYALDRIATIDQGYPAAVRAARACEKAGRTADGAYWDAVALGLRGEFRQALSMARRAVALADASGKRRARTAEAEALRGLKRFPEFVRTIEAATTEGTVDDLLLRGYAYYQAETPETLRKRIDVLRQAAQLAPEQQAAIRLQIAEQLRRTGRRDEAEREMETALAASPDDPELVRTLAGFYLDRADRDDRLRKALALSEKAVALAPDDERAWLQFGQCLAQWNELGRAARCLEHVIDLEPGYGPGYLELARVYARMGDKDSNAEMLALYQKYVKFEQRHDTLQTRARGPKASIADIEAFAELLLEAGDLGRATSEYERIMARTPSDKAVRSRLKRLYARLGRTEQLLALESAP